MANSESEKSDQQSIDNNKKNDDLWLLTEITERIIVGRRQPGDNYSQGHEPVESDKTEKKNK